jgi:hypothetical protein
MVSVAYPRKGRPWTDVDDDTLRLWSETMNTREIADLLGRTSHSVYERKKVLGLSQSR